MREGVRVDARGVVDCRVRHRADGPGRQHGPPRRLYGKTRCCLLEIIREALERAGGGLESVIRTRLMLRDISPWKEAARAHGEIFGAIRPACTFVEVSGLIGDDWLIEVEADGVVA
ncbi:MAG: RidA family protein [Proteobacteria bacterium]|nr:RidA family protein [Pseudomonadota bacterium]